MAAVEGQYYLDGSSLSNSTAVYANIDLTIKAPDGYYASDGVVREQSSGVLVSTSSCGDCSGSTYEVTDCNGGLHYILHPNYGSVQVGMATGVLSDSNPNLVECGTVTAINTTTPADATTYAAFASCDTNIGLVDSLSGTYSQLASMQSTSSCIKLDSQNNTVSATMNGKSDGWETIANNCSFGTGNNITLGWGFQISAQPIAGDHNKLYTINVYYTPVGGTETVSPYFSESGTNNVSLTVDDSIGVLNYLEGSFRIEIYSTQQISFPVGSITLDGSMVWGDDTIQTGNQFSNTGTQGCSGSPSTCTSSTACSYYSQRTNTQQVITSNPICGITI